MQKITCKLLFDRKDGSNRPIFVPTTFDQMVLVERELKEGDVYQIKISKGRSLGSMGKYRLITHALAWAKDLSEDYVHRALKEEYFGYREVINPFTGEKEKEVKSVSFDSMDEIEFKNFLNFVVKKIEDAGINVEELIFEYKMES